MISYTGENKAVEQFLEPTVKKSDFLTAEGLIRQEYIKKYLQSHTVAKAFDRAGKYLKELAKENRKTDGMYSVYLKTADPKDILDGEKLEKFLLAHGTSMENFKTKSKAPESLVIDLRPAIVE